MSTHLLSTGADFSRLIAEVKVIYLRRQLLALQTLRPDEGFAIDDMSGSAHGAVAFDL